MKIVTYDCEVFLHDTLVTFKDKETGKYTCIWNDPDALRACIDQNTVYIGFNSKHYDCYIIKAILAGLSPQEIKKISDSIVKLDVQGWQIDTLKGTPNFNNVDVRDDTQAGLSLKAIEGHLGLPIQETTVPFDIARPLTATERAEVEYYCKHDVNTTEKLIDLRKNYLQNKINLGKLAGIDEISAMGMTNAKLTAAMLKATAPSQPRNDERDYVYPENLKREYIPQEVFDFFDRIYDLFIPDEELFKSKLEIKIGECPVTLGFGGIHGAIPNYFWEETETRGIWNEDVGSFYPHLMTINGYTSRNIPSPKVYADVLERRMQAKASGDKATANALKLVCNTTYGCLLNQYNPLYDPLMGRSVCISGQLYLLELAEHCYREIDSLIPVQLNTDGLMVECDKADYPKLAEICKEWQQRTGFELEEDTLKTIAQKDVNNYVEVQSDGTVKAKGGYLVKGIAQAGAFNVNNSCVIVATALKEYLVNGTPVEETINGCNDIMQFQIIAKAGAKYSEVYHIVGGQKIRVQNVNRVYATKDARYGKLYKVKAENNTTAKIDSLPEHCIIDNENKLSMQEIDKTFYIEMAKKRIDDFKGTNTKILRGQLEMAATAKTETKMNVFQKLIKARWQFINSEINQSGKNMQLTYKYFELKDIVPTITKIFCELGLIAVDNFTSDVATLTIVNTDEPTEIIRFEAPFNQIAPIISNSGKQVTNDMQALGSSITYMRRYMYMIAMDICVNDDIEPTINAATINATPASTTAQAPEKKAPATPEQRENVKIQLTAPNEKATDLQITGLRNAMKKLRGKHPDADNYINKLMVDTKGLQEVTKADCERVMNEIADMLKGAVNNG